MKKLKVLIVDDEELAIIGLKLMLEKYEEIEIIGTAKNLQTAREAVTKLKPDVVFLDIEFPGESGFDLLKYIDISTKIVFVTAFDEFAIRAFEVNACDYLLKPVSKNRLEQTIKRLESAPITEQTKSVFEYNDQIFIPINYKYYFIFIKTITRILSAGKYSEIVTSNKLKGLVKKTMREWEECLPNNKFLRINRFTIINIDLIEKIAREKNLSYVVYLKDSDEKYVVSRRNAVKIRNRSIL